MIGPTEGAVMDELADRIGRWMLEVGVWKNRWRVEIDGCVFQVDIKGYPRRGTPHDLAIQEEEARALVESAGAVREEGG